MARRQQCHDATGVISSTETGDILQAYGPTPPTIASAGYAPGALFHDTDAAADAKLLINEGTVLSCNFKVLPASLLAAITATAAEINQAADESANSEIVITTNVIAASESGKTFYLTLVGGFTSTLPAPALGLRFRFIVAVAPTTAYIIKTNGDTNILFGMMTQRADGAGVAGAARDTFNFVASQAIIGDWVEFYCDGTNWYYRGITDVAAGSTVAAT